MKRYYYKSIFSGFYGVCVEKGFRDGFLNKCRKDELPIWRLKITSSDRLYFCVPCEFFELVRENAFLSGMQVKITGTFGLLPFMKKHKSRAFLFSGVIFTLLFLFFMSRRVWSIKVSGNDKVFESQILTACQELGLKCGVRKSKIDIVDFQYLLLEKMSDKLIWVSLNIEGMCAEIEVRELKKAQDDTIEEPCNYIADFDGVIKICRVYSGTAQVKSGSGVHKGDLLISAVIDYETGESSFTQAWGKITAQHEVKITQKQEKKISVRKYSQTKKRYSVYLFGFEIRLFPVNLKNTEVGKKTKALEINGIELPFGIAEYSFTPFSQGETDDERLLKMQSLCDYLCKVGESFKNSRVVSLSEKYDGGYKSSFEAIDYIGKRAVIMFEQ